MTSNITEDTPPHPASTKVEHSSIENGWRVFFTRTTELVQKLQVARRELALEAAINRLD